MATYHYAEYAIDVDRFPLGLGSRWQWCVFYHGDLVAEGDERTEGAAYAAAEKAAARLPL